MNRLEAISGQLQPKFQSSFNAGKTVPKSDDDVVICASLRTPMCKAKRGGFKDTSCEAMLAPVLKAVVEKSKVDPALIEDICIGNVLQFGSGGVTSRMAQFLAGIPETTSLSAVNRQCSSGLQAVANIANQIRAGQISIGIAGGVESMSSGDMMGAIDIERLDEAVYECENARNCMIPMGITSENVAEKFKVTRDKQDNFALESQQKAGRAIKNGWFKNEIVPVTTKILDKDGNAKTVTLTEDEGVRETTIEGLRKLKTVFKKDGGTTTAGNSSQVTDGAAAVLLARRDVAKKLGLPIEGRILSFAVAGVPPEIMGIGPAFAIPAALKKAGLSIGDIDVYEINEAFASQCLYTVEHLGIEKEKVNPNGGAIALGHPLGCTGARQVATLFSQLKRTNKKYGVISMCIGTGMGAASVFERE